MQPDMSKPYYNIKLS